MTMKDDASTYGYGVPEIKVWRYREKAAGRPCRLSDFFNAHGIAHSDMSNQPKESSELSTEGEVKNGIQ